MLEDANIAFVVTDTTSLARLPANRARNVCVDREWKAIALESNEDLHGRQNSDALAYIVYTSGSTGTPKAVEVRHRGIVRLLFGVDYVQLDSTRTLLHMAPISFDAATFELWGALLHGAKCVLHAGVAAAPRELGELLERHTVDTMWLTAPLFNTIIDEERGALLGVRQLLIGGEALSMRHVQKALQLLPHTNIVNCYGPTEATTFTTYYAIPRALDSALASVPIGTPIANTRVYILDASLKPVPLGVAGELHIGGDGLARGYLNRPELTTKRFVPDPFAHAAGSLLYKSGDLARYLPDGNIAFVGRLDQQVKIRGFRVEPGEVESTIKRLADVRDCLVTTYKHDSGSLELVAYVVASGHAKLDARRVRTE
jgi:amino acid adenylation domain-containing protein